MHTTRTVPRIALKNILYLTDFSEPSAAALPIAEGIAREYGARLHVLHVLMPAPYIYTTPELTVATLEAEDENGRAQMKRLDAQLTGLSHDVELVRAMAVWPAVEQAIAKSAIDLIVVGTHGRTGAQKLLLGSVAEEVLRRSPVPVLTVGPWVQHAAPRFSRVLLATDFSSGSRAAAPFAVSVAEEHKAALILLHVIRKPLRSGEAAGVETSVAGAMHELHDLVPLDAELSRCPQAVVEYGEPAEQILHVAKARGADLIVIGVHEAARGMGAAIHLGTSVVHKVVAHAGCAVLTVRTPDPC